MHAVSAPYQLKPNRRGLLIRIGRNYTIAGQAGYHRGDERRVGIGVGLLQLAEFGREASDEAGRHDAGRRCTRVVVMMLVQIVVVVVMVRVEED